MAQRGKEARQPNAAPTRGCSRHEETHSKQGSEGRLEETRKRETTRGVNVGVRVRREKRGQEEKPGWKLRSRGIGGSRSWTSRRHDAGDGTESSRFRILHVGLRVGRWDGGGNTLVAPLWRRRCERERYASIAPLGRGRRERATGWAWTGGALTPRRH